MNKHILVLTLLTAVIFAPLSVLADKPTEKISEIKKAIKEERKELKQSIKEEKKGLIEETKNFIKNLTIVKNKNAKILQGEVTAITDSSLTVSKDGKSYTVNTDSKTQFRRHFWGKSSLAEISIGDNVNVLGKFTDEAKTTILAKMIRDTSIQKRKGVFFGTVTSKTDTTLVIDTKRGVETVTIDGATKIVARDEKTMTATAINVGDRVRVKGLWDKTLNTISDVTQVKDFTQPVTPSVSPSVSPTPSAL
ncbi:MAG: hypothetical protein HYW86_00965 [Candidatus Roizmanbacteria bacterium]|nr:MAG: hypothetical protein HYW86_00965 [Candidatus Roizmanbacteria bacterium]